MSSIQKIAECIIGELRGIAGIRCGEYWNVSLKRSQKANRLTQLSRTFIYTHESRNMTLAYIESVLEKAFSVLHDAINESADDLVKRIKVAILDSQYGIINLKGIYHNDGDFKSGITNMITMIKERYAYFNMDKKNYLPYKPPPIVPDVPLEEMLVSDITQVNN